MCKACWADERGDIEDVAAVWCRPETRGLSASIKKVYIDPQNNGGPAHAQLDDWNTDIDVPVSAEQHSRGQFESEFHRPGAQGFYDSYVESWWFRPGSPYFEFAARWNAASDQERMVALAVAEGWERVGDEPVVWPPPLVQRYDGYELVQRYDG